MKRKDYQRPAVRTVRLHCRATLLSGSGDLRGSGRLGKAWENNSKDAWDGSSPSGDGSSMGGWTDKGGSAWE